jgi:hypothetical protein
METFYFIMAHLWAISFKEERIDVKGKPFTSFRFSKDQRSFHFWIKSLVVYNDQAKGVIKLLVNAGAIRYEDGRKFPVVKSYTLKLKGDEYAAFSGGKWLGLVPNYAIQDLLNAEVQAKESEPLADDEWF